MKDCMTEHALQNSKFAIGYSFLTIKLTLNGMTGVKNDKSLCDYILFNLPEYLLVNPNFLICFCMFHVCIYWVLFNPSEYSKAWNPL